MSRFFVGQRVRVVGARDDLTFLIGKTGILSDVGELEDWEIKFDDGTQPFSPYDSWDIASKDIEPILPSGQVAITLEQLLGVPGLESLDKILGVKA